MSGPGNGDLSPRQLRIGGNGKTKVVWELELLTAFICPGVDILLPKTLKQNQERNERKESLKEDVNM